MGLPQEIFEDKYDQQQKDFKAVRSAIMTDEEVARVDFYLDEYWTLTGEVEKYRDEAMEIQDLYEGTREAKDETDPNAYVNVILPNVEGQIASMTEQNIAANFRGKGVSDNNFSHDANTIMATVFKENHIKQKVKKAGRRYSLFGNSVFAVSWDPDALDGFGMPEIRTPQPYNVLVDGKIKDMEDNQKGDFIIEIVGHKSIMYARRKYSDEIANAIQLGNSDADFNAEESDDDSKAYTELHVWSRNNPQGNLQLLKMSLCGIKLEESDPSEPYYTDVDNKYPFFFTGLYPREGEFYRFGDGKLLKPVQELINKLFDEIILAVRFAGQARTFIDPNAACDPDQFDGDPSHPIYCEHPNQNTKTERGAGINDVVFRLVDMLFQKVQEMTRFSSLMTGNKPEQQMTATQAGIQQQQGVSGINDKRMDISTALSGVATYCLGLCMENWTEGQAFRITEDEDTFEWVDARHLKQVPVMIPADSNYRDAFKESNPEAEQPDWMQLMGPDGKGLTKKVSLDCDVSIGEGLPTSKIALFNIILQLAQLQLPDEMTGQPKPLLSFQQVKKHIEDYVGLKIEDPQDQPQMQAMMQAMGGQMPGGPQGPMPINQNANIPGANMAGQMTGPRMGGEIW